MVLIPTLFYAIIIKCSLLSSLSDKLARSVDNNPFPTSPVFSLAVRFVLVKPICICKYYPVCIVYLFTYSLN